MKFLRRITNLFQRSRLDQEIVTELQSHIDLRAADNEAAGMRPEAAKRDARLRFGNPQSVKEHVTGADAALTLESLWLDLRYGLRQLQRNKAFAATAIGVLALGICASAAIFAFVDAVMLRPLPYRDASRIVALFETTPLSNRYQLSYLDYLDWKRANRSLDAIAVYNSNPTSAALRTTSGRTASGIDQVDTESVSAGFFDLLGVVPILGRSFRTEEDQPGSPGVALLTYAAWQSRYGGRSDVIGQTISLDSQPAQIIGVLPASFSFAPIGDVTFWIPLQLWDPPQTRGDHGLSAIARLKPSITLAQASSDLQNIAATLAQQYPDADKDRGAAILPWTDIVSGKLRPLLTLLMSAAALLLLIAAFNVCSLLLVRSESRRREIAVRGALGAPRSRLIRQFLIEGFLIAAAAILPGLAAAAALIRVLLRITPGDMLAATPSLNALGFNWHVLAFGIAVAFTSGILFALTPLPGFLTSDLHQGLAQSSRSAASVVWRKLGTNLVIVELCTATILLMGASLLVRSFYLLIHSNLGIETSHLDIVRLDASGIPAYDKPAQQVILAHRLVDETLRLPGIESAAIARHVPLAGIAGGVGSGFTFTGSTTFYIQGQPRFANPEEANFRSVGYQYFSTTRAQLQQGRLFTAMDDTSHPPVVLVNQTFARLYLAGVNPIGQHIHSDKLKSPAEVVGVVANIQEGAIDGSVAPVLYAPFDQVPDNSFYIVARTTQAPSLTLTALESVIRRVDSGIVIQVTQTMDERIQSSQPAYLRRAAAWLAGGFAVIALILGVIGLYGVIAYSVSQRTREIGVRMALGAQRSSVSTMVLAQAARLIAIGVVAGLLCSLGATTLMRSLLFGVAPWDIATLITVGIVLTASSLLASYLPARRAASVNPVEALRAE
ncbi:ADOP family duplicated permease [Acidicapsa dinghuensis]|uniref:ADOP family duplicated permease n=1 Tax=Acidicapsa dinghuensis TaxID=2218256 RepID=A0ABW1ENK5_9BACT|nr:ABC transporter permease [Acidicapsa dinghuensis]